MSPKTIIDEFLEIESRQERYQARHKKSGRCRECPALRAAGDITYCLRHRLARRARDNARNRLKSLAKKQGQI